MAEKEKKPQKPDDDPVGKVYDSRLMRRLGHYLLPYWFQALVSTLAISLKSLCDVTGPFLVMVAIDRYFPRPPARRSPPTCWPAAWARATPSPAISPPTPSRASPNCPRSTSARCSAPISSNSFRPT